MTFTVLSVGVSWKIVNLALGCSVHLYPFGLELFGTAYTVQLSYLCLLI